jgi:hypothetical protein
VEVYDIFDFNVKFLGNCHSKHDIFMSKINRYGEENLKVKYKNKYLF